MNDKERAEALALRKLHKLPWHGPPHFGIDLDWYHISAACYEHAPIMPCKKRLSEFEHRLIDGLRESGVGEVRAWAVLPNHYHLLIRTNLVGFGKWIARLHNLTSKDWNKEDDQKGRRVWHRYADRKIRGEIHYYRTVNYIHANPVKHGYVERSQHWPWSSFIHYEQQFGRDQLVRWWREYSIKGYGEGWDD